MHIPAKDPEDTNQAASLSDSLARLRELFAAVVDLDEAERAAWLQRHVADPDERRAVERLLAADSIAEGFLETPAGEHVAQFASSQMPSPKGLIGQRVGAFELTRLLGRGGMAAVFLGERVSGDFVQLAAIKMLRRGLYSDIEQKLFRRERQLLAALHHPNIAQLIDGGITDAGIPFLVIEYVDGETITEHAQARQLTVRERVDLFLIVCRAVATAHRALIVHRDIKPSNIMVARDGSVKLLDFGIAKLIEEESETATYGVFTPAYAAPEQLGGGSITTATDVYSLGVLLYELLLGERPQQPARRPSLAARSENEKRLLRGDLDTILLKAIAHEPDQRYASAATLADDVERHLAGHPVEAHAPSGWYRTRKFVQRHRGGVTVTILFFLGILVALSAALWQTRVARSEAERANAMRDFMFAAFAESEPGAPRKAEPAIGEVVERAVAKARGDKSMNAAVRVELLTQLGVVLRVQGREKTAQENLEWNYAQARQFLGKDAPATLAAGHELMYTLLENGELGRAQELGRQLLLTIPPADAGLRSRVLRDAATLSTRQHDLELARSQIAQSMSFARSSGDSVVLRNALEGLGNVQLAGDDAAGATATYEELLVQYRREFGPQHLNVASTEVALSRAYRRAGQLDLAEQHVRAALEIDNAVLDKDDWRRAVHLNALMAVLHRKRDFGGALDAAIEGLRIRSKVYGEHNPDVANDLNSVGWMYALLGNYVAAVPPLRESLQLCTEQSGPESYDTAVSRENYGWALAMSGDAEHGEVELRHAITSIEGARQDSDELATANEKLVRLKLHLHQPEAALQGVDRIEAALKSVKSPTTYWDGRADVLRAEAILQSEHGDAAQMPLESAAAELAKTQHPDPLLLVELPFLQAQSAARQGDTASAHRFATEARARLAKLRNPPENLQALAASVTSVP